MQRFNFDQGREVSLLSGRNLVPLYNPWARNNLLNYVSNGHGFTVFTSYPLKRTFARVGLTYGYDISNITVLTDAAKTYFDYLNFQQGIARPEFSSPASRPASSFPPTPTTRSTIPSLRPAAGASSSRWNTPGGPLGGNVNMIRPSISSTYFRAGLHARATSSACGAWGAS